MPGTTSVELPEHEETSNNTYAITNRAIIPGDNLTVMASSRRWRPNGSGPQPRAARSRSRQKAETDSAPIVGCRPLIGCRALATMPS